jgi:predicted nucleic acid-binding Zn ribbon protein
LKRLKRGYSAKIKVYSEGQDYCEVCGKPIPAGKELCKRCRKQVDYL